MAETKRYGVIWDMDGTLVDTAELHFTAWQAASRELGHDFTRADFAATFGRRNPEIMDYLFPKRFTTAEVDAIGERKEVCYRTAAEGQGITLLPGVRALLEGLHALGVRQAIGSSAPRANLELILRLTGVAPYLTALVGMEDTTRGKPDPQVFQTAASRLELTPERCLVVEDAVAGVQAAKAGGMKCVAVRFVGHHSADKLTAAGADRVVASLEELTPAEMIALIQ